MEQAIFAGNFTEAIQNVDSNVSLNATVALPPTVRIPVQQSFLLWFVPIVGMSVSITGSISNSVVLVVLILARRQFGSSSVNTMIINQTVIDLFACISVIAIYGAKLSNVLVYRGNQIADNIICVVLQSGVFAAAGITAGQLGLVVITLERYFKIVHAVAHRKYYRSWMTKVGVALPWIGGACLTIFPLIGTTRVVNRRCFRMAFWPNKGMAVVRKLYCNSCIKSLSVAFVNS